MFVWEMVCVCASVRPCHIFLPHCNIWSFFIHFPLNSQNALRHGGSVHDVDNSHKALGHIKKTVFICASGGGDDGDDYSDYD